MSHSRRVRGAFASLLAAGILGGATAQIIADHRAVADYDNVPQVYLDQLRGRVFINAGASHAEDWCCGVNELAAVDNRFTGEGARTADPGGAIASPHGGFYLCRAGWPSGYHYTHPSDCIGWMHQSRSTGDRLLGLAEGWCWGWETVNFEQYTSAFELMNDSARAMGYGAIAIYSTGPNYSGNAQACHEWAERLRSSVLADDRRVLMDWADILYYGLDGDRAETAEGYPYEHPDWMVGITCQHINPEAGIRIAKAVVWMCARMLGWDGGSTVARPRTVLALQDGEARNAMHLVAPFDALVPGGALFDCRGRVLVTASHPSNGVRILQAAGPSCGR